MKLVWFCVAIVSCCSCRRAWISPRVCSFMAGLTATATVGDASGGVVDGEQPMTIADAARTASNPLICDSIWVAAPRGSVRGGRDLPAPLRRVLRLPLGRRRAEALVVDLVGDRRVLAADRALRIAPQLDLAERRLERVEEQVAPDERLADREEQLQRFVRLDRADDTGEQTEHAGLGARWRELRGWRGGEEAAVARTLMRAEDGDLSLEAIDASVHDRLVPLHRRVVEEIARREVVGTVDDHVVVRDDPVDVVAREPLLVWDDRHVGVQRLERLLRGEGLRLAQALHGMQDLALQVRLVDDVGVDDTQCANAP